MNRFSKAVRKLTAENEELDAEEMQARATKAGATTVARCGDRVPVTVLGTIRAMTIRPRAGVPALEAELYDGSGTVTLVWLGRRTVAGLGPGRQGRGTRRSTTSGGRKLVYHPRYDNDP